MGIGAAGSARDVVVDGKLDGLDVAVVLRHREDGGVSSPLKKDARCRRRR